ncbi:MAG: hypothetical protein AB8C84_12510 [Oligoflexales bacterium]
MENEERVRQMSEKFLAEVQRQSSVVELQLHAIRELMTSTVDEISKEISEISKLTGEGAEKAEALLERAYFEPESGQVDLIDTVQQDVDQIFDQAANGGAVQVAEESDLGKDRLRRFSGQFSKHMEAMSTLDSEVAKVLINVMGGLSHDDVIGQRTRNLSESFFMLRDQIGLLLKDQGEINVQEWSDQIQRRIYQSYTSEAEKQCFVEVFGTPSQKT